jgi:hypothetical protein
VKQYQLFFVFAPDCSRTEWEAVEQVKAADEIHARRKTIEQAQSSGYHIKQFLSVTQVESE